MLKRTFPKFDANTMNIEVYDIIKEMRTKIARKEGRIIYDNSIIGKQKKKENLFVGMSTITTRIMKTLNQMVNFFLVLAATKIQKKTLLQRLGKLEILLPTD